MPTCFSACPYFVNLAVIARCAALFAVSATTGCVHRLFQARPGFVESNIQQNMQACRPKCIHACKKATRMRLRSVRAGDVLPENVLREFGKRLADEVMHVLIS